MSRKKLKELRTEIDNLIGNLRGEIGEIIFTWILMKDLLEDVRRQESPNLIVDFENPRLVRLRGFSSILCGLSMFNHTIEA